MVGKSIEKMVACILYCPHLLHLLSAFSWPFIWGIYLSFCKFTTVKDVVWVGLANYKKIIDRR